MGKDMDDTGKNTENRPKKKKAGASGSGIFSVVGGGKKESETGEKMTEKKAAASPVKKNAGKSEEKNVEKNEEKQATEKPITTTKETAEKKGKKTVRSKRNVRKRTAGKELEKGNAGKEDGSQKKEVQVKATGKETAEEDTEKTKTVKRKNIHRKTAKKKNISPKSEESGEKKGKEPENGSPSTGKEDSKKGEAGKEETGKKGLSKEEAGKKGLGKEEAGKKEPAKGKPKKSTEKGGTEEKSSGKKAKKKKGTVGKKKTPSKTRTGKKDGKKTEAPETEDSKTEAPKTETAAAAKRSGKTRSRNPNLRLVKSGEDTGEKKERKKNSRKETYKDKPYREYDDKMYMEGFGIGEWLIQHKSLILMGLTACVIVGAIVWGYYFIVTNYRVTTVYVDGNVHYSNEEIMDMVMTGPYGNNSLYLAMKYKDKGVEGVPFVEKMDVNILTPNTIRINVYEKALAGYVEYLGRYMYFDRDGIVVESSREKTTGIPQVTGLKFGYVILNEALPVENDAIFKRILSITQLLDKYELSADKIYFDSDYDLTLYFDGVRVTLGSSEEIDEKVMRLQYILPELSGKTGTLSMENYTEDTKSIPFRQN